MPNHLTHWTTEDLDQVFMLGIYVKYVPYYGTGDMIDRENVNIVSVSLKQKKNI